MGMSIVLFLFIVFLIWLSIKFTWVMLKIGYVLCIGLPLATVLLLTGVILCCTLMLAPIGTGLMRMAGRVLYPF